MKTNGNQSLSPSDRRRGDQTNFSDAGGEGEEEDDFDLPLDLGVRTWSKLLSKEERAKRVGYKSKTAVLSIQ